MRNEFSRLGNALYIAYYEKYNTRCPELISITTHINFTLKKAGRSLWCAAHYKEKTGSYVYSRRLKIDRKSTRLNSSHVAISYAVFCLKKKKTSIIERTATQIE